MLCDSQAHFQENGDETDAIVAFRTPLTAYDALLVLREDALPQAARSLQPSPAAAGADATSYTQCKAPSHATRAVLQPIPTGGDAVILQGTRGCACSLS